MQLLLHDPARLSERMANLPTSPGIYQMRTPTGELLYVGKAKNLRNRVRSYFQPGQQLSPRIQVMVQQVGDVELIVTDTEAEALTLEETLIKRLQPRYNVLLKDDKQYPSICITWSEEYPRLFVTRPRGYRNPKDKYFGPYVDAGAAHQMVGFLKRNFSLRQRGTVLFKDRPCINYDLGRCPGVCQRLVSPADYRQTMQAVQWVLQGRVQELVTSLSTQMAESAALMEFERAARLRDQIQNLEALTEKQKLAIPDAEVNRDALAVAMDAHRGCVQLFQVRAGRLIGRLGFSFQNHGDDPATLIQSVIQEHYQTLSNEEIPGEILVSHLLPDLELLEDWLRSKRGRVVEIQHPQRQTKAELIELVSRNAQVELERMARASQVGSEGLVRLTQALELPSLPQRIECYDISHIQGTDTVASRVVFVDGKPAKEHYRKYKIRDPKVVAGAPDDFASMAEVIRRRFTGKDPLPDLVVIDGGKGQLSASYAVLEELGLEDLPVIGLAKRLEEIFRPGSSRSLQLDLSDSALRLLQQVRDEAHRFAITFHRDLRGKRMTRSVLADIPGLGPARQKKLIEHFGSLRKLQEASVSEIATVPGISIQLATTVHQFLREGVLT
ncbi:excinuclease ABC subunit UvrC [Candidatus Cyanaurora vandensis]|uniref:excinuclease ABC subunit UvrC n=1 Tax=Candidatus Cyanaurora vandensis TaxID=2714958 RepID=UPI00257B1DB1|nr:excinuclease ABC subunit UvrC [Candidatus Cyanaurora vandensis]